MGTLVAAIFTDRTTLQKGIDAIIRLHADGSVKLNGSAVVAKDTNGKVSVEQVTKPGHGGTVVGAFIGALAALPLGPLAVTIGAAGGALIGDAADLLHRGDEAELAKRISGEMAAGSAVIVAEVAEDGLQAFEAQIQASGGTVIRK